MENYTPKPSVSFQPVGRIFARYQALRTRLASLAQFFMPFHSNFCHFFPTSESGTKLDKKGTEVHKNLTLK